MLCSRVMHLTDRGRDRPSVQEGTALSGDCIIKRVQYCLEIVSSRGYSTVWRLYHQEGTALSGDCIIKRVQYCLEIVSSTTCLAQLLHFLFGTNSSEG